MNVASTTIELAGNMLVVPADIKLTAKFNSIVFNRQQSLPQHLLKLTSRHVRSHDNNETQLLQMTQNGSIKTSLHRPH